MMFKNKKRLTTYILLGGAVFLWIGSAHAAAETRIIPANKQALLQTYYDLGRKLIDTKVITQNDVRTTLSKNLDIPETFVALKGAYLMGTGDTGTVKGEVPNAGYAIKAVSHTGIDISVPESVVVNGKTTIPVGIREGTGQVKKVAAAKRPVSAFLAGLFGSPVYAADAQSAVKVSTYYDKNGNGIWDRGEKAAPWAGISVVLSSESAEQASQQSQQRAQKEEAQKQQELQEKPVYDNQGNKIDFGKVQIGQ